MSYSGFPAQKLRKIDIFGVLIKAKSEYSLINDFLHNSLVRFSAAARLKIDMKQNTIKEIVDRYLAGEVPEQVRSSFEGWITDGSDSAAKNRALAEAWDSFEAPSEDPMLPSAEEIMRSAENQASPVQKYLLWLTSAAAAILAVVCLVQFMDKDNVVTCLASSESSIASYVLPDGTKLWLNKNSSLTYSGNLDGKIRKVRLEGEAYLDVAEDAEHPFIVEARELDIKVLGTEFTVTAYEEENVSVYLQEGCVSASGPGINGGVTLTPNQSLTYNGREASFVKNEVRASNHTSWIGKRLVFHNTSLYDIMESMSHWYNVDISCNDVDFAKSTSLSLTIRQESIIEILESIELILPVTYTESDSNTIIIMHNI